MMAFAQQSATLLMRLRKAGRRATLFSRAAQDASAEDLARCDGICIICREEMAPAGRNKKLPCSHVFHLHCLRRARARALPCAGPAVGSSRGLHWVHSPCPQVSCFFCTACGARARPALRGACRRFTAPPSSFSIAFMFNTASCPA